MARRNPADTLGDLEVTGVDGTPLATVPGSARAEMRSLVTRADVRDGGFPATVAVTAPVGGEGTSFVARALAAVLALDLGRSTCLVSFTPDADDAVTADHEVGPGIRGLFTGTASAEEVMQRTGAETLRLLGTGTVAGPVDRDRIRPADEVLAELVDHVDHVVLDLPPVSRSMEAMVMAGAADGALVVARQRMTRVDQVERTVADLGGSRLLGVVLNDHRTAMPSFLARRLADV